jgi:hypothetical protein
MRLESVLLSAALGLATVVLAPAPGAGLVAAAHAADSVSVVVDVVRGAKGAAGSDQRSNKHRAVLDRVPGYGGWKFLDAMSVKLVAGTTGSLSSPAVSGRKVAVTLESFSGSKAKTRVVVTDPNGKSHKITSTLGKGATTVLTTQSAGGREVHLFIVTVSW